MFMPGDLGTKIYVMLVCKTRISSFIAASQQADFSASLVVFGSLTIYVLLLATSIKCRSFDLFLVII